MNFNGSILIILSLISYSHAANFLKEIQKGANNLPTGLNFLNAKQNAPPPAATVTPSTEKTETAPAIDAAANVAQTVPSIDATANVAQNVPSIDATSSQVTSNDEAKAQTQQASNLISKIMENNQNLQKFIFHQQFLHPELLGGNKPLPFLNLAGNNNNPLLNSFGSGNNNLLNTIANSDPKLLNGLLSLITQLANNVH